MATFDPAAATAAYVATMSPAQQAKAIAYTHQQHWLLLLGALVGVLVAFVILKTGVLRGLRDRLERRRPHPVLAGLILPGVYLVMSAVLGLPWAVYANWRVETEFGMTSQPLADWFREQMMREAIGVVFGALVLWAIYGLLRRTGRAWPLWGGAVVAAFAGVGLLLAPLYIEPIFNKFTPAPAGPVRDTIVQMARANGVPSDKIFIYDGSKQSNRYTANVAGLAGTARVAMSDVMFRKGADIAEVRGVVGHEMGHYVHQHALWGMAIIGLLSMVLFWLADALFPLFARLMAARGVTGIADPAGLPVLMAVLAVLQLLSAPALNSLTRITEADADSFSLEHANEPDGLSRALIKTADYRAPEPGRLEEVIFYDHPSVSRRIRKAMDWKAAHMDAATRQAAADAAIDAQVQAQPAAPAPAPHR